MNKQEIINKLDQNVYYLSFSHKRIEQIIDYMETHKLQDKIDTIFPSKETKEASFLKIVGILAIAGIDKIGNKLLKNYKESELRIAIEKNWKELETTFKPHNLDVSNIKSNNDKLGFDIYKFLELRIPLQEIFK